jgi:streptogramin lyase
VNLIPRGLVAAAGLLLLATVSCGSPEEPTSSETPAPSETPASSESATAPTGDPLPAVSRPTEVTRLPLEEVEDLRVVLAEDPDRLAVGFGSLWVQRSDGAVVRLDADGNVLATIDPDLFQPPTCAGIGVSDHAVWACATNGTLVRIDPVTNKIAATLAVPKINEQGRLTSAGGHLWVLNEDGDQLRGIKENTDQLTDPIPLDAYCTDVADTAEGGELWIACASAGEVLRVDLETGEVTARIADLPLAGSVSVAEDVWVGFGGGLARIDKESLQVIAVHDLLPSGGAIRASADAVWVREPEVEGSRSPGVTNPRFLTRLDPATGATLRIASTGLASGGDVIEHDGAIWATSYDDQTVVRVTPPAR